MGTRSIVHPKEKGQRSEAAVLHKFIEHRLVVLQPFGDTERYDIVVEESGNFYRVQIKTGRLENGRIQFETRSSGTLTKSVKKDNYRGDADVFAVYSPAIEEVFIVPISSAPETSMGLRIEEADKESPNINWASEFTVEQWVQSIRS
jgi:hypothetical protein